MSWILALNHNNAREVVDTLGFWPGDIPEDILLWKVSTWTQSSGSRPGHEQTCESEEHAGRVEHTSRRKLGLYRAFLEEIPVLTGEESSEISVLIQDHVKEQLQDAAKIMEASFPRLRNLVYQLHDHREHLKEFLLESWIAGIGLHYLLIFHMRKVEEELGIWTRRTQRQKLFTCFLVNPEIDGEDFSGPIAKRSKCKVPFSRVFSMAPRHDLRLCAVCGGPFPQNYGLFRKLSNRDVMRSLSYLDESYELLVEGQGGKLLAESGIVNWIPQGFSGKWFLNLPVVSPENATDFLETLSGLMRETARCFSPLVELLYERWEKFGFSRDRGPGDYLEMAYSVLAARLLCAFFQECLFASGTLGARESSRKPSSFLKGIFRRQKEPPRGWFIVKQAEDLWKQILSLTKQS
ncbi:MAG: hypothetical protein IMF26_11115 [Candidatus Fermentithermobacillus carboniphilus]|uniref:Uncharacterized protein n=1 Tax=Candidatus Fermentithermobacillus carboniphilus TaxID=3085328 RepID=A0AAT9LBS2_9FIRM|nr:MAG: hypothetical protein IMF26_11115 [Candidatus Fermentithermobacillus carboniphilus]